MESREKTDGEYVMPPSIRKGPEAVPGWRDPERAAQNWRDCARLLRRYVLLALIPGLALLWFTGYATGLLEGYERATRNETQGVEQ